jgi:hypothetical protein
MVSRCNVAIPVLQKAIALDKRDYQSSNNLDLANDKLGKPEQGIDWGRQAAAFSPRTRWCPTTSEWFFRVRITPPKRLPSSSAPPRTTPSTARTSPAPGWPPGPRLLDDGDGTRRFFVGAESDD